MSETGVSRWRKWLARALWVAVLLCCLWPSMRMVVLSLRWDGSWSLDAYDDVLRRSRQWGLLGRSLAVSAGATAMALAWGLAVGSVAARLRHWGGVWLGLGSIPLLLPSLVLALGWVDVLGRQGWGTAHVTAWTGWTPDLYTPTGVAWILSLAYFPVVSLLVAERLRRSGGGPERAARLVSGRFRSWRATLSMLTPTLMTAGTWVFVLIFHDVGVPSTLTVNVYPVETLSEFRSHFDVRRAVASAMPPMLLTGLLFGAWSLRRRPEPVQATAGAPLRRPSLREWLGGLLVLALSLGVPLGALIVRSGNVYAEALRTAGDQVWTTLEVTVWGMIACSVVAGACVWAARHLGAGEFWVASLALWLPMLVPGAAVGLGVLDLVAEDVPPWSWLYPHPAVVSYAAVARFVAVPTLVVLVAVSVVPRAPVASARLAGWSGRAVRWRVVLPWSWRGWVAAATLGGLLTARELSAAVLVHPPGAMTLPVRLESLLHFGQEEIVAALCVIQAAMVTGLALLGVLVAGHRRRSAP